MIDYEIFLGHFPGSCLAVPLIGLIEILTTEVV